MAKASEAVTQREAFIKAALDLGADDDPERFKQVVAKLGKAKPAAPAKPKKKPARRG